MRIDILCSLMAALLAFVPSIGLGQSGPCGSGGCPITTSQWPAGTQSTTSTSFVAVATDIYAGEWARYSVTLGRTYEWSLCASDGAGSHPADYVGSLTLRTDADPGVSICYSDGLGFCFDGKIRWTATFNGIVRVQVNELAGSSNVCGTNLINTTLVWRVATPFISSLSPNPMVGLNPQSLTIYGSGFSEGCNASLDDFSGSDVVFSTQFVNSGQLILSSELPLGAFLIEVVTPGGIRSNARNFSHTAGVVGTPTLSIGTGTFTAPISVLATTTTPGAIIRYTTNGSTPTTTSAVMPIPLTVSSTTTLIVRAFKPGFLNPSDVVSAVYTFNNTHVTMQAVDPYRARLLAEWNYSPFPETAQPPFHRWFWRWSGSATFPQAELILPAYTRVWQGGGANRRAQCVQFVRQVSNMRTNWPTSSWRRDVRLVANGQIRTDLTPGTIIATMDGPNGTYASARPHTAVYLSRVSDTQIMVADQNFVASRIVGRHDRIRVGGTHEAKAGRYWTVVRPILIGPDSLVVTRAELGACCTGGICTTDILEADCVGHWTGTNFCGRTEDSPTHFCCPGDFGRDGVKDADDLFQFLRCWFAADPAADWDAGGGFNSGDIFLFLADWIRPC